MKFIAKAKSACCIYKSELGLNNLLLSKMRSSLSSRFSHHKQQHLVLTANPRHKAVYFYTNKTLITLDKTILLITK